MTPRNPLKIDGSSPAGLWLPSLICCVALFVGGCQQTTPEAPVQPPLSTTSESKVDAEQNARQITQLLEQAAAATRRGQQTSPYEGSALQLYEQVLALDPAQSEASYGLQQIVEEYIQRALLAAERRQFASARSMLARARLVMPNHPSIEPTTEQLRLLTQAQRSTMTLRQEELQQQPQTVAQALHDFASADNFACRFVIHARSDAQGRWIYKMMRGAEDVRLRAQIQIQSPTRVERQCFEDTSTP